MEPKPTPSKEIILADIIVHWLEHRPLMHENNSAILVAFLLQDEMKELHEALENPALADEIPDEIADTIFFILCMLSQLPGVHIRTMIHAAHKYAVATYARDDRSADKMQRLSNLISQSAHKEDMQALTQYGTLFLVEAMRYAFSLRISPIEQTIEKAAFNQVRYLTSFFELTEEDEKNVAILHSQAATTEQRDVALQAIQKRFKDAKAHGRRQATATGMKEKFYDLPEKPHAEKKALLQSKELLSPEEIVGSEDFMENIFWEAYKDIDPVGYKLWLTERERKKQKPMEAVPSLPPAYPLPALPTVSPVIPLGTPPYME